MKTNYPFVIQKILFFVLTIICCQSVASQGQIQVDVLGGSQISDGATFSISQGNAITFRVTNVASNCGNLRVQDIVLSNLTDFSVTHASIPINVKGQSCKNGLKHLDFTITNISGNCGATTDVTISHNGGPDFQFTFGVSGSPEINILGGSPSADILHGSTITSATNGTYYGVVDEGASITRSYIITNSGSCPLNITSVTSSLSDFIVQPLVVLPDSTFATLPQVIDPGSYIVVIVVYLAPLAATPGTHTATLSVYNDANSVFTFDVSAEIFDFNIPGPGGITADFRLWLKSTRGVTSSSSKVSLWKDIGTNGKDASQLVTANQPTYVDSSTENINCNPVIQFENNGSTIEQYLTNTSNGFYSQDIFIVMMPDATMDSSSATNTIFAGVATGLVGDITGISYGNSSSRFTNETLSYNQNTEAVFNGVASLNTSFSSAGIINVRNNATSPTDQEILYNSVQLTTNSINDVAYANVGYTDSSPPFTVFGTQYWIGKTGLSQGSLNGRVAEIFTFAERVTDTDRSKIESYLAIKYGMTLGSSTEAEKDYVNSFDTTVWDITTNAGYNYHVAGIGRDSISDLNQKQSKTLNLANEVTIGLGGIFSTNSVNTNEFKKDGDFLVWGTNNAVFTGSSTNTVTIASGITTNLTRIDRKWKIIESIEDVNGDVEDVYISIPVTAFSGFTKLASEEYVLIVADSDTFTNADIIDVIPLKSDGDSNLLTWYDFDTTKYFTFGKAQSTQNSSALGIGSGDYLVGEKQLNLNVNDFTISTWIRNDPAQASLKTIMSKGDKLQLRINASNQVEIMVDDSVTPKFTSTMVLNDDKWHQITFIYNSGTIFLYIDGVLDKSEQNIMAPSTNYNHFAVGALYVDKNTITNPFLGEIDEIYVWDQGLTENQVRYLMNQEVERFDVSGTDYVNGKVLPGASSSNEGVSIPWSKLKAYYDLNSFYGSTVEGLTDSRNFLRLAYLNKNKDFIITQTAPLPYINTSSGTWDDASIWANGTVQYLPNALSLDGTTTIDWNIVSTAYDMSSGDRDISLLGLKQLGGTFSLANPNETLDETNSGHALIITHYLELDGVLDLIGESQLIQEEGSVLDVDSGGYIERDQQGVANSFNYNYWSIPVAPISGNTATTGTGTPSTNATVTITEAIQDGTDTTAYTPVTFNSSYTAADAGATSPITISSYWMYKFYGAQDQYTAWQSISQTSSLNPGEGFTMKGSSGAVALSNTQNYVFKGLPYNGDITLQLDNTSEEVSRLVGNPYPSALDVSEFILDNMSTADGGNDTETVFNGALYFWDHFGQENSHMLSEYVGGYATRNLITGVAAISNDARINNTSNAGGPAYGTKIPGPYVAVGQGFFVSTALEGFNNNNGLAITTIDGGTITFKNSQRSFVRESSTNSIFYRPGQNQSASTAQTGSTNPIIKLMFDSPEGYHRQIAVGVNYNATNNFDMGYDAFLNESNPEDMYWYFNENKFVIQGVINFNTDQELPLGLVVNTSGIVTIKIDTIENLSADTQVYIKDNQTNITHNISTQPLELYLTTGTYNNRFSLVFQPNQLLTVDENTTDSNVTPYYDDNTDHIKFLVKNNTQLLKVIMYNILGQKVLETATFNQDNNHAIPVNTASGMYVLKISTNKGIESKKVIIK